MLGVCVCMYVYIYTQEEAWGSPERNSSSLFASLKNVIVHRVLQCFVFFP